MDARDGGTKPRVLLVDDNQAFRDLFPILFERWFAVTAVPDAEAARRALARGRFDAVVTDYDMAGAVGAESDGPGRGARFYLRVPTARAAVAGRSSPA